MKIQNNKYAITFLYYEVSTFPYVSKIKTYRNNIIKLYFICEQDVGNNNNNNK